MINRRNFVWEDTGTVRIMVHGHRPPTNEEWETFLSRTVREVNGQFTATERRGAVIYSRGAMATPHQRNQLRKLDFSSGRLPRLVLMTDSLVARGVATAIGWLVPALKDFHALPLDQVDEAARLLSPIVSDQIEFKRTLARLLAQLDE